MVESILTFGARNRLMSGIVILLITVFAGIGASKLQIDTSYDSLVSPDDPGWPAYHQTIAEFGSDSTTIVYVRDSNLWTADKLVALEDFVFTLEELPDLENIDSVFHSTSIRDRDGFLESQPLMDYAPVNDQDASRIREDSLYNPLVSGNLVSPKGYALAINLTTRKDKSDAEFNQRFHGNVQLVIDEFRSSFEEVFQVGPPRLNVEIEKGMFSDLAVISPLSGLLLIASIVFFLRTFSSAALPIVTSALSILWTFGFMGYFGIPLTLLTAIVPSLVIVIGSTEDTHLLSSYLGGLDPSKSNIRMAAIRFMAKHTGLPIFITGFTTTVGFLSNGISDIPLIQDFAYASGFAMFANLIVTILALPLLLSLIGPKTSKVTRDSMPTGVMGSITRFFEAATASHGKLILTIAGSTFVFFAYTSTKVEVSNDPLSYFKSDHQLITDANTLHEEIAGMQIFYLTLDAGVDGFFKRSEYLKAVQSTAEALRDTSQFDKVVSISDHLSLVNREMNGGDENFYHVPQLDKQVAEYLLLFQRSDLDGYLMSSGRKVNIVVRHNISDSSELNRVIESLYLPLSKILSPLNIEYEITGENILINSAAETLFGGQIVSLIILVSMIVIIMTLLYSSIKVGLISLVPNLVPVIYNFGVMGLFDIPLNPGTATVAAIAVGIAIDDTIHLLTTYGAASRKYLDPKKAIQATVRHQAIPVISTSISLALGFGILVFSDFAIVAQFGLLAGATMIYALFADLLITPVVLKHVTVVNRGEMLLLNIDDEVIQNCPLFKAMSKNQIKKFILLANQKDFNEGENIVSAEDTSREMFVLLSGEADVLSGAKKGGKKVLESLGTGDVFGELAFLNNAPRSADVVATKHVEALVLSPQSIEKTVRADSKIAAQIYKNLSSLVARRLVRTTEKSLRAPI